MRAVPAGEMLIQCHDQYLKVRSRRGFNLLSYPHPRPFSRLREKGACSWSLRLVSLLIAEEEGTPRQIFLRL